MSDRNGFTVLEFFVTFAVIATLAVISIAGIGEMRPIIQSTYCANSLRQLGMATTLYLADHKHKFFSYSEVEPTGRLWYFGFETYASIASPEGTRDVDVTKAPIYPYVENVGGVEVCPSFPYGQTIWKAKYRGVSWGYGFNTFLSGANSLDIQNPGQVLLFGDCAQVNTFQPPATLKHPMIEEFYIIDNIYQTIHFRHAGWANILFLDGHVQKFNMCIGTQDTTLPSANIGRITPFGSMQYLR